MISSAGDSTLKIEEHILVFSVTVVSALEEWDLKCIRVKRNSTGAKRSLPHQAPFPCITNCKCNRVFFYGNSTTTSVVGESKEWLYKVFISATKNLKILSDSKDFMAPPSKDDFVIIVPFKADNLNQSNEQGDTWQNMNERKSGEQSIIISKRTCRMQSVALIQQKHFSSCNCEIYPDIFFHNERNEGKCLETILWTKLGEIQE